jgi:hypothetical protein
VIRKKTAANQPTAPGKQTTGKQPPASGKQTAASKETAAGKQTPAAKPAAASKQAAAKTLTAGQRAYEAKRAAKAGMSLDKWLDVKRREQQAEERARLKAAEAAKPPKKPGFFSRLIERAQRPLGRSGATARTPPR